MSKPTPGPWKVIHKYEDSWTSDGFIVEGVLGTHIVPDGEQKLGDELADYQLMASAPQMLEALQEIVNAADDKGWEQLDASFAKARAAIAKATGQS
jgi:hypothetical protein